MEFLAIIGAVWFTVMILRIINAVTERNQIKDDIREQVAARIHDVELEHLQEHGNLILAYDRENNRFLGQSHSLDGIKTVLKERWPTHIFIINGEPFSALEQLNEITKTS